MMLTASSTELLRNLLRECRRRLIEENSLPYIPLGQARPRPPEFGHFHIFPEFFYQISGTTRFQFPSEEYLLRPRSLLIVPPLVTHAETVHSHGAFQNLVVYATKSSVSVHLALEGKDKKPTIDFINRRSYSYGATISRHLADAVTFYEYGASAFFSPAFASGTTNGMGNGTASGMANEAANASVGLLLASALAHTETVLGLVPDLKTEPNESRAFPPLVVEARERVLAALSDHRLSVAQIADWLSCSSDYLSHLFKIATGESLTEYTQRSRLERAKDLLKDSELSVKEISWACGFSEESYFIRKFKDRFGLSPGLYRRS